MGDLQLQPTERAYPSNEDRYAAVHRDKAKVKISTVHTLTLFDLGMGPEFSSDIAGDGPRKRNFDEDDYDPELERTKKRKILNSRRSKSSTKASNQKQNSKRTKDDRKKDNAKQNSKRTADD